MAPNTAIQSGMAVHPETAGQSLNQGESMHDGGIIERDGVYNLRKGEVVLKAGQSHYKSLYELPKAKRDAEKDAK
jgi:hypothetical protein